MKQILYLQAPSPMTSSGPCFSSPASASASTFLQQCCGHIFILPATNSSAPMRTCQICADLLRDSLRRPKPCGLAFCESRLAPSLLTATWCSTSCADKPRFVGVRSLVSSFWKLGEYCESIASILQPVRLCAMDQRLFSAQQALADCSQATS